MIILDLLHGCRGGSRTKGGAGGKLVGMVPKTYLTQAESRWFSSSDEVREPVMGWDVLDFDIFGNYSISYKLELTCTCFAICAASYMVICLYSCAFASLSGSPSIPSQINKSAPAACSTMLSVGLESVQ